MYLVLFYNYYAGYDLFENDMSKLFDTEEKAKEYADKLNKRYMLSINHKLTDELLSYYDVIYIPKGE